MIDTQTNRLIERLIERLELSGWWLGEFPEMRKFNQMIKKLTGRSPITLTVSDYGETRSFNAEWTSPGTTGMGGLCLAKYDIRTDFSMADPALKSISVKGEGLVLAENNYSAKAIRTLRHCVEDWVDFLNQDSQFVEVSVSDCRVDRSTLKRHADNKSKPHIESSGRGMYRIRRDMLKNYVRKCELEKYMLQ